MGKEMSCYKYLKELPTRKGFPVETRRPRRHPVASEFANQAFGYDKVSEVMNKFHRASIAPEDAVQDWLQFDRQ